MVFFCILFIFCTTQFYDSCISTRSYLLVMLFFCSLYLMLFKKYFAFISWKKTCIKVTTAHCDFPYFFLNQLLFLSILRLLLNALLKSLFGNVFISVLSDINIDISNFFWSIFHSIPFVFMLLLQPVFTDSNAFLVCILQLVYFVNSCQCSC